MARTDHHHVRRASWNELWRPRRGSLNYHMRLLDYSVVVFQPASRWIFGRWQARAEHLPSGQAMWSKHQLTAEDAKRAAAKLLMDLVAWVHAVRERYRREGIVGNLSTPDEVIEHHRRWRSEP